MQYKFCFRIVQRKILLFRKVKQISLGPAITSDFKNDSLAHSSPARAILISQTVSAKSVILHIITINSLWFFATFGWCLTHRKKLARQDLCGTTYIFSLPVFDTDSNDLLVSHRSGRLGAQQNTSSRRGELITYTSQPTEGNANIIKIELNEKVAGTVLVVSKCYNLLPNTNPIGCHSIFKKKDHVHIKAFTAVETKHTMSDRLIHCA